MDQVAGMDAGSFKQSQVVRRHKGFTLIELLVVIAIIALLVSILMPALSKAREIARKTVCAAHMHGIGLAIQEYSQSNDGWLPPRDKNGNQNNLPINHWARWFRVDNTFWNLGLLWDSGQINDGKLFFCPSRFATFKYQDYAKPMFPTNLKPCSNCANGVRIPYSYNPICKSLTDRTRKYTKANKGGANILLLADLLTSAGIAHKTGWNVMLGDGSVKFSTNAAAQDIIKGAGVSFETNDFADFDEVLRLLQE